jgi:predicted phage terminase large subunit-like protein
MVLAAPPPNVVYEAGLRLTARRQHDRRHLLNFTRRMFPHYQTAHHHERIATELERIANGDNDRLIITMPPRHGKSLLASEHFPAWFLGQYPDKRIIGCAHTATLAYTFSRRCRNKLADPQWPFPDVRMARDLGNVQSWDIAGHRGGYVAAGVGGAITGHGADVLLIDDPVKSAADADSQVYRDATWEWFTGTAATRLEPGGAIVVIGTRWHDDDLIGRILSSPDADRWTVLHLPALDEQGAPLWPERFDAAALEQIKREIGARNFQAQFQGDPVPAEGGTFKRQWWRRYRVVPERFTRIELMLDSAFKEGAASDYSAIGAWGDDGSGSYYLLNVWRARVAFPELIRLAHDAHSWARTRFPSVNVPLVIEDKASGQSAIQVLSRPYHTGDGVLPALPVIPYAIPAGASKVARAEGVTPLVEGGRCFIPESALWLDDWLTEHERFPFGAHDDQVDTTSMALTRFALSYEPAFFSVK